VTPAEISTDAPLAEQRLADEAKLLALSAPGRLVLLLHRMFLDSHRGVLRRVAGAWLVLPFAGLELLGLGIALLAYARHAADYERVSVTDGMLVVETASASRITREVFNPRWVRVELGESFRAPVVLRSDKRSVQVGLYLDPYRRRKFAQELAVALQRV
jgi:uncharacterized membrane protein